MNRLNSFFDWLQDRGALNIFIFLTVFGVVLYLISGENGFLWRGWMILDTTSAIALAMLAFLAYRKMIKDEDEIKIFFSNDDKKIDSKLTLLRRDCTRSEILGLLGMININPKERFKIQYTQNLDFLKELQKIQKGEKDEVCIKLVDDELKQFKIGKRL